MGDNPNNSQLGKNYILIGPQGSGKGTQAKILSQKYNLQHISTGDLLREISQVQSVLGDKIKKLVNSGELIPDEMLMEVFQNELQAIDKTRGILLDGIPRTLNQAKLLDNVFTEENLPLPKAINININQQAAVDRVTKRRTCKRCQTPYLPTDSSAISGICEACGGEGSCGSGDRPSATWLPFLSGQGGCGRSAYSPVLAGGAEAMLKVGRQRERPGWAGDRHSGCR